MTIKGKRKSPTKDKYRLAENFKMHASKTGIVTKEEFDKAYDAYMTDEYKTEFTEKHRSFVWEAYQRTAAHKAAVADRAAHPAKKKRMRRAAKKKMRAEHEFEYPAIVAGRDTFAWKSEYSYKGKKRTVYRDDKGRFATPVYKIQKGDGEKVKLGEGRP